MRPQCPKPLWVSDSNESSRLHMSRIPKSGIMHGDHSCIILIWGQISYLLQSASRWILFLHLIVSRYTLSIGSIISKVNGPFRIMAVSAQPYDSWLPGHCHFHRHTFLSLDVAKLTSLQFSNDGQMHDMRWSNEISAELSSTWPGNKHESIQAYL